MFAKMKRKENSFPFLGSKKKIKQKMDEVFITKTKKMYGTSKENIGQEMKKPLLNFLLK